MPNLRRGPPKKVSKPVKPKKPLPAKEEAVKIQVPRSVLTEERVRKIVREEIIKWHKEDDASIFRSRVSP